MFPGEICEIFKKTSFTENLRATASIYTAKCSKFRAIGNFIGSYEIIPEMLGKVTGIMEFLRVTFVNTLGCCKALHLRCFGGAALVVPVLFESFFSRVYKISNMCKRFHGH